MGIPGFPFFRFSGGKWMTEKKRKLFLSYKQLLYLPPSKTLQFACLSVSKKPFPCNCTFALRPSNSYNNLVTNQIIIKNCHTKGTIGKNNVDIICPTAIEPSSINSIAMLIRFLKKITMIRMIRSTMAPSIRNTIQVTKIERYKVLYSL